MARLKYIPCPKCGSQELDLTKSVISKNLKRRYMFCFVCGHRWWTIEFMETVSLSVIMNHHKSGISDQVKALKEEVEQMVKVIDYYKNNVKNGILSDAKRRMLHGDQ